MDFTELKKPFPAEDIEWRVAQCGKTADGKIWAKVLAYITSRAVHDRLDAVVGPGNWQMRYTEWEKGAICEIGIKVESEWVWKAGGGDPTDYEAFKGMLSSAEKRAGVPWGIGRYLYGLKEDFAECLPVEAGKKAPAGYHRGNGKDKGGKEFYFWWKPPELPKWALPEVEPKPQTAPEKKQPKESVPEKKTEQNKFLGNVKSKGMTDKQRADSGLIISKYINELAELIEKQGITSDKWKLWLSDIYGFPTIYAIKVEAYAGILKTVKEHPEHIKNYTKREEYGMPQGDNNEPPLPF